MHAPISQEIPIFRISLSVAVVKGLDFKIGEVIELVNFFILHSN